jgi:hypothetical protein
MNDEKSVHGKNEVRRHSVLSVIATTGMRSDVELAGALALAHVGDVTVSVASRNASYH